MLVNYLTISFSSSCRESWVIVDFLFVDSFTTNKSSKNRYLPIMAWTLTLSCVRTTREFFRLEQRKKGKNEIKLFLSWNIEVEQIWSVINWWVFVIFEEVNIKTLSSNRRFHLNTKLVALKSSSNGKFLEKSGPKTLHLMKLNFKLRRLTEKVLIIIKSFRDLFYWWNEATEERLWDRETNLKLSRNGDVSNYEEVLSFFIKNFTLIWKVCFDHA